MPDEQTTRILDTKILVLRELNPGLPTTRLTLYLHDYTVTHVLQIK